MNKLVLIIFVLFANPAIAVDWDAGVRRDMGSDEARNYRLSLSKFIKKSMKSISPDCPTNRQSPTFDLYVQIENDGSISEKKYSDVSPEAICVTKKLSELVWPSPPTSPFVFKVTFTGGDFAVKSFTTDYAPATRQHPVADGNIIVSIHALADGSVGEIKLLESSGDAQLNETAKEHSKKWTFQPLIKDGKPVDYWKTLKIKTKLKPE